MDSMKSFPIGWETLTQACAVKQRFSQIFRAKENSWIYLRYGIFYSLFSSLLIYVHSWKNLHHKYVGVVIFILVHIHWHEIKTHVEFAIFIHFKCFFNRDLKTLSRNIAKNLMMYVIWLIRSLMPVETLALPHMQTHWSLVSRHLPLLSEYVFEFIFYFASETALCIFVESLWASLTYLTFIKVTVVAVISVHKTIFL